MVLSEATVKRFRVRQRFPVGRCKVYGRGVSGARYGFAGFRVWLAYGAGRGGRAEESRYCVAGSLTALIT